MKSSRESVTIFSVITQLVFASPFSGVGVTLTLVSISSEFTEVNRQVTVESNAVV